MRKELYSDQKIKVTYFRDLIDEHDLIIGDKHILLQRGVLEELARTSSEEFKFKLHAIDPDFNYSLKKLNLSYAEIGFAIAQARVNELEEELSKAYSH
ncbi:MAG: hypothetical protein AABY06_02350 [Nanoarchaeota archaeon]